MTPREELEALRRIAELEGKTRRQPEKAMDPTGSFLENLAAGAGKAIVDTGRGVRQLLRIGDQEALQNEIDEAKRLDAPLMDTGGGMTGNIGTQIGTALLPGGAALRGGQALSKINATRGAGEVLSAAGGRLLASPATLGGAVTQAGVGGAMGAAQPVATGESRTLNAGIGAAGGAVVPAAGMALKAAKGAVEPLYEGGRNQIVGRAMRGAAGGGADDAIRAMQGATELVPGSLPTAGQVSGNGGIAAMERSARAIDPASYATRDLDQNAARVAALRGIAGDEAERAQFQGVRELMTELPYKQATSAKVPLTISDRKISEIMQRPSLESAWQDAEKMAREAGNTAVTSKGEMTGESLHYLKMALDQKIADAKPGSPGQRLLMGTRDDLRGWMEKAIPEYKVAREGYAQWSKPLNQMDIGQHLLDKLQPALSDFGQNTSQRGQAYAQAIRSAPATIKSASGSRATDLADIMSSSQMNILENVGKDLARKSNAENLGRG